MTAVHIIFLLTAVVTLIAALLTVTVRNLVHAALWLVLALFGVAVTYVLLNASFLAVAQVVIYIGAIAILMIFAIMLTRKLATEPGPQTNSNWPWGAGLAAVMLGGLIWIFTGWPAFSSNNPPAELSIDPLHELGKALVMPDAYVIPFEVASILLLAALIGALIIAWDRGSSR